MKVFDCFLFLNEVDLLEIRLNILDPYVDYFVIVQSTHTFTGKLKDLIDIKKLDFIEPFKDKIISITDVISPVNDAWENEIHQRNYMINFLNKIAKSDDIIMLSDVDEIPNLENFKFNIKNDEIWFCQHKLFYYYFNLQQNQIWYGTAIFRYNILDKYTPQQIREMRIEDFKILASLDDGINKYLWFSDGWHFSYIGNIDQIKYKLQAFAHTEYAKLQDWEIEYSIKYRSDLYQRYGFTYKVVGLENMPKYIIDNIERYKKFLIEE